MLTKEKCVKALDAMCNECCGGTECWKICKDCEVIDQLINEHFELQKNIKTVCDLYNDLLGHYELLKYNPPLKFEELKEGMWVWDNKHKDYLYITDRFGDNCIEYYSSVGSSVRRFKENRFYLREVKE